MIKRIDMLQLVHAERSRANLEMPKDKRKASVKSHWAATCSAFENLGFHRTLSAMEPLKWRRLLEYINSDRITGPTLTDDDFRSLNSIMNAASSVFDDEARQRSIVELTSVRSQQVATLETTLRGKGFPLVDYQLAMLGDMTDCLQVGLSRQAIVTAWMLGYDIVRKWVYSDKPRLDAFNAWLTPNTKKGLLVSDYEDFFTLNEAFVLTACWKASGALDGFTNKIHRTLEHLLDERNAFAHSNFRQSSDTKAEAFIERLFDVICEKPFVTTQPVTEE
jgi:hypothetical protein